MLEQNDTESMLIEKLIELVRAPDQHPEDGNNNAVGN